MTFQDHFSGHASDYARARPRYPPALFGALAVLAPGRSLAWDAGTGNGQAAAGLAEHFTCVVATDPSAAQLAEAAPHRSGYRDLPFPFQERPFPVLEMRCRWSLSEFMAYLGTWSAVQRFRERQGRDPLLALRPSLASAWGEPQLTRDVCWPLTGRAGTST
jgi:hypothetical protein